MDARPDEVDQQEFAARVRERLARVYPEIDVDPLAARIAGRSAAARQQIDRVHPGRFSQQDLLIITYGDKVQHPEAHPLASLHEFLYTHVREAASAVHLLPFFPYSSDDGFSVIDYRAVDPELGDWADIGAIAEHFDLMFDLVINHVSRESSWFLHFLTDTPPYNDYFIEVDPGTDLSDVVRPRSSPLLAPVQTHEGQKHVWATFSADQIDLNFANPDVLLEFVDILSEYMERGARYIRADAIAYLWKEIGTSCIHLPQTHEVVKLLRDVIEYVRADGVLLTETNVPNEENLSYFGDGDEAHMIYQFSLPPLLLHALHRGDASYLTTWAQDLPEPPTGCSFLNITASHDGIGLRPAEGILPDSEIDLLIEAMRQQGGYISMRAGGDGVDRPYEINISLFDAFGCTHRGPDQWGVERFLCGQAIKLALKGVPGIYFHNLTATPNHHAGVSRTGRLRTINRRKWDARELVDLLNDERSPSARVFFPLTRMMRTRRLQKAFHPYAGQEVLNLGKELFGLYRWTKEADEELLCLFNLTDRPVMMAEDEIPHFRDRSDWYELIGLGRIETGQDTVTLLPYQVMWLAAHH